MIETIFNYHEIPKYVNSANSARFIIPFAKEVCKGIGYDIGCGKKEWAFPGSIPIDPLITDNYDAMKLPDGEVDYIFSSHTLEHLDSWVNAIRYWTTKIKSGGVLFFYLPSYNKISWRPWINWSHKHILHPNEIKDFLEFENKYRKIYVSGIDLNYSFAIMCEKK